MRTLLLASAAALALGAVAQPALALDKATVGGRYLLQIGLFDFDNVSGVTDSNNRDIRNDIEIHFDVEGTLDNGLKYGAQTEIQNDGDNVEIDEAWIFVEGSWGRIELGDQDGAIDKLHVYAPAVGTDMDIDGDWYEFVDDQVEPLAQAIQFEDDTKIYYVTPKLYGLQFGVSWVPDVGDEGEDVFFRDNVGGISDGIELGLRYSGKFEGGAFRIMGGYTFADTPTGIEDINSFMIGFDVAYGGFTFGGGYVDNGDSAQATGPGTEDESEWNVGLTYENGPWGVGVNYVDTERFFDNGFAEQDLVAVMGNYKVAKGLEVGGHLSLYDQDFNNGLDNEGYIFMFQTMVKF